MIDEVVDVIAASDNVTLVVGIGASDARPEVLELADLLGAPIVAALRVKETFEWDNPYYVGLTELMGNRAAPMRSTTPTCSSWSVPTFRTGNGCPTRQSSSRSTPMPQRLVDARR